MYIGWVSVTGMLKTGILPAAAAAVAALFLPFPFFPFPAAADGTGWKPEKTAFCCGWHGVLAFDEATLWFFKRRLYVSVIS